MNKILNKFYGSNPKTIELSSLKEKPILHFMGGPGSYSSKLVRMDTRLKEIKEISINENIRKCKEFVEEHLIKIINRSNENMKTDDIFTSSNIKNICNIVLDNTVKNVLDIGNNSIISTLLMLITNPDLIITCLEFGQHSYLMPCFEKLKEIFGDRIIFSIEDCKNPFDNLQGHFDFININDGHFSFESDIDIKKFHILTKKGTILSIYSNIFTNFETLWNKYLLDYYISELDIFIYNSPDHIIKCIGSRIKV